MAKTAILLVVAIVLACACAEFCQLDGTTTTLECTHLICGSGQKTACVSNICTCVKTTTPPPATTAAPPPTTTPPPATTKAALSCVRKSQCVTALASRCATDKIHCFDNRCNCETNTNPASGCSSKQQCVGHTGQQCSYSDTHCYDRKCYCRHFA